MAGVEEGLAHEIRIGGSDVRTQGVAPERLLDAAAKQRLGAAAEIEEALRHSTPEGLAFDKLTLDEKLFEGVDSPELQKLIQAVLEGSEPLDRPLLPWEPKKFSAAHVNVILMRAAGFKPAELAQMLGFDRSRISVILKHPYAIKLLSAILPMSARHALNTRARLDSYASRMVDRLYQIGIETDDEDVATRIGFGLIDRSSYAPTRQAEIHHRHTISAPSSSINRLSDALAESQLLDKQLNADFTISPLLPSGEGDVPVDSSVNTTSDVLARSPGEPPVENPPSQEEKVA